MNLLSEEKIIMDGDYKQITLTTHRVRQENKSWGQLNIVSIMLEKVTSCEYSRKSRPMLLVFGILLAAITIILDNQSNLNSETVGAGLLIAFVFIVFYFLTLQRGLFISSATAKIVIDTKGINDENIKSFIDKLEAAKNDRFNN